jgi:hypothetical protein
MFAKEMLCVNNLGNWAGLRASGKHFEDHWHLRVGPSEEKFAPTS